MFSWTLHWWYDGITVISLGLHQVDLPSMTPSFKNRSAGGHNMVRQQVLVVGFHTCVSKKHGGARCLPIYGHQCSQTIPAFATKAWVLASKLHMFNFSEKLWDLRRNALWLRPMGTENAEYKNVFCLRKEKAKPRNNDFWKVVIYL